MYATAPAGEPALASPPVKYPSFGNSYMQYDGSDGTLKKFYSAFMNFSSRRPFNEVDQYRLQDAPDRRIRRLMEKENKRARDDARKDYNEAVRSLASFLKKRDPRFLNSTSSDPLRVKQLEKQKLQAQLRDAAQEAARKREENAKTYREQDWQKVETVESESDASEEEAEGEGALASDAEQEDGSDPGDQVPDWYCPACEKEFASQGAWDNHERSKKHLKNVEKLKRDMLDEEDELGLSQQDVRGLSISEQEVDLQPATKSRKDKKRGKRKPAFDFDDNLVEPVSDDPTSLAEEIPTELAEETAAVQGEVDEPVEQASSAAPEVSKREKRRAREAAKKASGTSTPAETCNVCQEAFSSRTKLFSHIKDTGHAAAQESSGNGRSGRKGKR